MDGEAYDAQAKARIMFVENFAKFETHVDTDVRDVLRHIWPLPLNK